MKVREAAQVVSEAHGKWVVDDLQRPRGDGEGRSRLPFAMPPHKALAAASSPSPVTVLYSLHGTSQMMAISDNWFVPLVDNGHHDDLQLAVDHE